MPGLLTRFVLAASLATSSGVRANAVTVDTSYVVNMVRRIETDGLRASIEAVLSQLPEDFRANFTLIHSSQSLQQSSHANPRVVMFSPDGKFWLAFNGDPSHRGYNRLEMMEVSQNRHFIFREISFSHDRPAALSAENPRLCMECHAVRPKPYGDAKPIWAAYNFWQTAFGTADDIIAEKTDEFKNYREFIERAFGSKERSPHPRYRWLVRKSGDSKVGPYRATKGGNVDGIRVTPNFRVSLLLDSHNARRIAERVTSHPIFPRIQYTTARAIICNSMSPGWSSMLARQNRGMQSVSAFQPLPPGLKAGIERALSPVGELFTAFGLITDDFDLSFREAPPEESIQMANYQSGASGAFPTSTMVNELIIRHMAEKPSTTEVLRKAYKYRSWDEWFRLGTASYKSKDKKSRDSQSSNYSQHSTESDVPDSMRGNNPRDRDEPKHLKDLNEDAELRLSMAKVMSGLTRRLAIGQNENLCRYLEESSNTELKAFERHAVSLAPLWNAGLEQRLRFPDQASGGESLANFCGIDDDRSRAFIDGMERKALSLLSRNTTVRLGDLIHNGLAPTITCMACHCRAEAPRAAPYVPFLLPVLLQQRLSEPDLKQFYPSVWEKLLKITMPSEPEAVAGGRAMPLGRAKLNTFERDELIRYLERLTTSNCTFLDEGC